MLLYPPRILRRCCYTRLEYYGDVAIPALEYYGDVEYYYTRLEYTRQEYGDVARLDTRLEYYGDVAIPA